MSPTHLLSNEQLIDVLTLSKTATAIHIGEDATIQFANDAMLAIWGKDKQVIGRSLEDALPELKGQPFIEMFRNVWLEGLTISGSDTPATLVVDGRAQTFYFDFEYRAVKNELDKTICILHTAIDVTERFLKQAALDEATQNKLLLTRELELNEELAAANEELLQTQENLNDVNNELEDRVNKRTKELAESVEREQAMNEELLAANEELEASIQALEELREEQYRWNLELRFSEKKLDDILRQLPSPVVLLRGPDQVIDVTNEAILSFWNKTKQEVTGRPMLEVFPEINGQPFPAQWKHVYETGQTIINKEMPVTFMINGEKRLSYVDYYYQPIDDIDGKRSGVLATVIDVTHKVDARKQLEENQVQLQTLNNELSAFNEEITATNEELVAANDELAATRGILQEKIAELAESEEKLKIAIETGKMGTWSINPVTLKITMSNFVKDMLGLNINNEVEMDDVMRAIHADYHQMLFEALNNALKHGMSTDTEYPITNLITGEERWVKATGKVLHDALGNPGEYTGMFMDITERKLDELRKNDFIGMVSHELKTPLTSLTAIIQVTNAKLKNSGDNFLATALDKANIQVKKMSTMINGFLNISRLESGKIQLDKKQFDLNELAGQVIEETRLTAPGHVIELLSNTPVITNADQDKIGSVISNLLSNAVKYSSKGKLIQVQCETTSDGVQVSVKDQGMGISPKDIDHLFDRYYRVDNPNYSHISGFGIGLYLSAEIMHQHGGQIWVESTPDVGSTFYFSLPVK